VQASFHPEGGLGENFGEISTEKISRGLDKSLYLCYHIDMEYHYLTRLQGIRRRGGTVQLYANLPLPLAAALDLEPGETVTWKVLDRTHLLLVRLPERKQLKGQAAPRRKKSGQRQEDRP